MNTLMNLENDSTLEAPLGRTIVVAEDDAATRMLLCRILRRENYRVIGVENGRLACDAVRREQPDLILLDWVMPVMDGRAALAELKADAATRSIPIMMLSSHGEIDEKVLALTSGVQDFITKPVDARELVARIEQQVNWRKLVAVDVEAEANSERLSRYSGAKVNSNLQKKGFPEEASYIERFYGTTKKRW
ncbi:MAG: response regulator [Candidatus Eremiobacteraeota bacterium]|nr:response regulator [Candidatus Eremiobacteraeota bacterium]